MGHPHIPIARLRVGVFIRLDLPWFRHPFMRGSFRLASEDEIEVLAALGLTHVQWVPERSAAEPLPEVPPSETRPGAPSAAAPPPPPEAGGRPRPLTDRALTLQRCEKHYEGAARSLTGVTERLLSGSEEAVAAAGESVRGIVETLLPDHEAVLHLMNSREADENVFRHALNVAILALLLGRRLGLAGDDLTVLGLGALFHDVGKHRVPKAILYKSGPLAPAETAYLRLHTHYGEEMMARVPGFPEGALAVIRCHHEAVDGSGYPAGLLGKEIPRAARITAVADSYDRLVNTLDPAQALPPHEALSQLLGAARARLDQGLVAEFVRAVGLYPPGSMLELAGGALALVLSANPEHPLRPRIILHDPSTPRAEAREVAPEEDLVVARSLTAFQCPPEAAEYLRPRTRVAYTLEGGPQGVLAAH